jgi:uncharacterized protein (DUF305 family)
MTLRIALIAAVATVTLAACSQDPAEPTADRGGQGTTNQGTGAPATPGDAAFAAAETAMHAEMSQASGGTIDEAYIAKMIAHHRGAIAMADVALAQSQDPGILRMAQTVKDTQTAEIAEMQAWEPAPPAPAAPATAPNGEAAATSTSPAPAAE